MNQVRVDLTSARFRRPGAEMCLQSCKAAALEAGIELGIQLHNTAPAEEISWARSTQLPLTAHAPLLSQWLINLGARSLDNEDREVLETSAAVMRENHIKSAVMHCFVMTDQRIPAFGRGRSYDEAFGAIYRPELCLPGSRICADFLGSEEFLVRRESLRSRLAEIRLTYPDLTLAMENDFPTYGSANLFADTARFCGQPVCLDIGHLWAAAFIFDRDFYAELEDFLDTGLVTMVHFHASTYDARTPKADWGDGHQPLSSSTPMDLPRIAQACYAGGIRHFVLEIPELSERDVQEFGGFYCGSGNTEHFNTAAVALI